MSFHDFKIELGLMEENEVYQYEVVNEKFRNQCFRLVFALIDELHLGYEYWRKIEKVITIEFGKATLVGADSETRIQRELSSCNDFEALYMVQVLLGLLYEYSEHEKQFDSPDTKRTVEKIDATISAINKKMLESSLGYELVEGKLIRMDNKFIHQEVVVKSIKLLHENGFQSASEDFLQAYSDYKNGNLENAITNAGKAFESTMKIICDKLGYVYKQKDTSSTLVKNLFDNQFIPSSLQAHFGGVRSCLESGLPTMRNRYSHGSGILIDDVTITVVQYSLNLCATNIVFLVETYKAHENTSTN
ncbi:STM4504/CBY_0614 family protein [Sporosarcina psychrophila]|uniref:STM4504/CBY_0614 family protein n=1 Tax=Sporosarcina psychrophila TaxID=1476 RepID=UPI00078D3192|nr:hypothetical protein [Sporosarcina psychrophila]AMQ06638.1 hypothetical protein AZE41_12260 [Sporosarcina psychrophila]